MFIILAISLLVGLITAVFVWTSWSTLENLLAARAAKAKSGGGSEDASPDKRKTKEAQGGKA
ncbi:MAG: hypothetical protein WC655_16860 [Candidatus Hydrogenedentales bacterium]|jgi:hypothetical protein